MFHVYMRHGEPCPEPMRSQGGPQEFCQISEMRDHEILTVLINYLKCSDTVTVLNDNALLQ